MKRQILTISTGFLLCLTACNHGTKISEDTSEGIDSLLVAKGETVFTQNCSSCHNFQQDGIGPQLGGLTAEVSSDWIKRFIKNPQQMIESGDERSQVLFEKYKTIMPSFTHYTDEEIEAIVSFISTKKGPDDKKNARDPNALQNPIPEPIAMSDLVLELEPFTQIPPSSDEGQLTRICKLGVQPETNTLFIVDLRGKLYKMENDQPNLYMDMTQLRPKFIHNPGLATGFGSFAFHPEFQKNGLLYTTHVESPGSGVADFAYDDSIKVMLQWVLTEWKTEQPKASPFSGKGRELFRINMVHSFHGVQEITFNPLAKPGDDDYELLYIGVGDGSSVEFGFPFLAHSKQKIWGTILRIDPSGRNSRNGKYGIPENNPFVNDKDPNTLKEIYAYGFRNPHRISWTKAGQILASNIGHHNVESLNMIFPGHDYGWPIREGAFVMDLAKGMRNVYALPPDDKQYGVTYPVAQYDHDEGNAISGGYEYWGSAVPALKGKYLFGDIVNGRLFFVEMKDLKIGSQAPIKECQISVNGIRKTLQELCGAKKVDVRFGRDHLGELYVMTKPDGRVYRIVSAHNSSQNL